MICRAHQLHQNGFQWSHENNVLTIFSAPSWNLSAIMEIDENMDYKLLLLSLEKEKLPFTNIPDYFLINLFYNY